MTGIIHLRDTGRMSRRSAIVGAAATLAMASLARTGAQTPVASPVTRGGTYMTDARDRLRSMLAMVPRDVLSGVDPTAGLFTWADLEAQFNAFGSRESVEDRIAALGTMVIADDLLQYAMNEETLEFIGFSVFDVHQVLVAGSAPDRVVLYAGGVDFAALSPDWEDAGYVRMTGEHGEYWTLGEKGEPDFTLPAPFNIGGMNNLALLAEDTVVFTRTSATLERVLSGQGTLAADDPELTALIDTLPSDTVNVLAFPGATFRADTLVPENPGRETSTTVGDLLAESDAAVGPMPPLMLGMVGVTSGAAAPVDGTPPPTELEPRAFMTFLTASEDDAETAAEVAFWRLENMQSPTTGEVFRDRFTPVNTPDEAAEGRVMSVEFGEEVATTGAWARMVLMRDTWPFAWLDV